MLNQLRQKLTQLVIRRKMHRNEMTVRRLMERLEERAMLSATYGSMSQGHGGPDYGQHDRIGGSHFAGSGAFVSQQQHSADYGHESGWTFREYQDRRSMYEAYDRHGSLNPMWQQFATSPAPMMSTVTTRPNSTPIIPAPNFEPTLHYDYVPVVALTQKALDHSPPNYIDTDTIFVYGRVVKIVSDKSGNRSPGSLTIPLDPVENAIRTAVDGLAAAPALGDMPSLAQILPRETNTVAALSALAHEVAFQEFAPKLVLTTPINSYDRTNLGVLVSESTPPQVLDGFIDPSDPSIVNDIVQSTDAVVRERDAVEAVLRDLHHVDTLLPPTTSNDTNVQIDLSTETAADDIPVSEVDGGMVMLQSSGNGNESSVDLTPVYAKQLEPFDVPTGIETSVGFYQAVDVAVDEISVTDAVQPTNSTIELSREINSDDNRALRQEKSSSNNAAGVISATALTGALIWINRRGFELIKPQRIAQEKRGDGRG
jgi:hypothetical protein